MKKKQPSEYLDLILYVLWSAVWPVKHVALLFIFFFLPINVNYSVNVTSGHPSSISNLRWKTIDAFIFSCCCCFLPLGNLSRRDRHHHRHPVIIGKENVSFTF